MSGPTTILEALNDHEASAQSIAQHQRAHRNAVWLQGHWDQLLPQACGRHLAIAGEEPFVAESARDALALAAAAHPEDDGILVQFVLPPKGVRQYGDHGVIHLGIGWHDATDAGSPCSEHEQPAAGSIVSGR